MTNEWQPMDSAPRDGHYIVAYAPDWWEPMILRWGTYKRGDVVADGWMVFDDDYSVFLSLNGQGDPSDVPTMWAPIPQPPI